MRGRPGQRGVSPTWVWALLACYGVAAFFAMLPQSPTLDEPLHLWYGSQLLRLEADRGADDSKMPFSALNALPSSLAGVASRLSLPREARALASLQAARTMTILLALTCGLVVTRWSQGLWGGWAGILSLGMFMVDPNLMAHGGLVTSDLGASFAFVLALSRTWAFLKEPTWPAAIAAGAVVGLAQLAKYTAIHLYPLVGLLTLCCGRPGVGMKALKLGAAVVVGSLAAINAGFLFQGTGTPLRRMDLVSAPMQRLQRLSFLADLPIPLPTPYVQGLDRVIHHDATGATYPGIYLRGQLRRSGEPGFRGFPDYFLWCFLLKVPLGTQALLAWAAARFVLNLRARWRQGLFLLVPCAWLMLHLSLWFNTQLGIRFILPIFPLLYVFAGQLASGATRARTVKVCGLILASAVSVSSYYPHLIPYFNELVLPRTKVYRYLADSNVDWGQNLRRIDAYLRAHPGTHFQPPHPVSGRVVVTVNSLVGLPDPEAFRWLREHFTPVGHVAYAALVFQVSDEELKDLDRAGLLAPWPRPGWGRHRERN